VILRLGVLGLGVLGGSVALRARSVGYSVIGADREPQVLAEAWRLGLVDELLAAGDDRALLTGLLASCDALVIATPVEVVLEQVALLTDLLKTAVRSPRWIVDLASVKACVVDAAVGIPQFVGTHPIAGSERRGPSAADAELFLGRPWVLTPAPVSTSLFTEVTAFVEALGGTPLVVDAHEHDAIVAQSSHLPQSLATVLAATIDPSALQGIHGSGLASMLRLAGSSWSMWRGIYRENASEILTSLRQLRGRLNRFIDDLEQEEWGALETTFHRAAGHAVALGATPADDVGTAHQPR